MTNSLYTAVQCHEIDKRAMQALGLSGLQLMHRAADAAMSLLLESWSSARRISLYCGPGNNGGDGYLLAAKAHKLGYKVRVWAVLPAMSDLSKAAQAIAIEQGLEIHTLSDDSEQWIDAKADLRIDAIFGHGLTRPIEGTLAILINQLNQAHDPVLALDIPSGINSDTGAVMGVAIQASMSCSFIAAKLGMFTGEGPDYSGKICEYALGVSPEIYAQIIPAVVVIGSGLLKRLLPMPGDSSHKGDFGHVAIIGGHPGMVGAVILAALAAARSGAGKVTVLSDEDHIQLIQQANPVLMTQGIQPDGELHLIDSITAIALGPGLGCEVSRSAQGDKGNTSDQQSWSKNVFESALQTVKVRDLPLVVDADALNLLATFPRKSKRWVLTPHPKEAATLLGVNVQAIQADRPGACRQIAQRYGGVCVLKGKGSLISDGSEQLSLCNAGNWGMATGGSGDVLSGVIAAFLALGMNGYAASRIAVEIHARAGDQAAKVLAKRTMIATDIIDSLPAVFNNLEKYQLDEK